jgi:rhodanese-related sulfurtransferase/peroxiredoxin
MLDRISRLLGWKPLEIGEQAPPLSLTADEGTWIKLADFKTHLNVLLVFFREPEASATDAFFKELQASLSRFQDLETAVFGISTFRTDRLRAYRARIGVEFYFLYDPFAWESRGFRASGRVRPFCKDTVVLLGKDGKVLFSERGFPSVEHLLQLIGNAEGKEVPPPAAAAGESTENLRSPGKKAADVQDIESKQAMEMLSEKDSPFVLVDVRTRAEVERERSPLVKNFIPVDEIPHRYNEIGQTTHVIFVCQGGGRSAAAAEFMTSIGASHIYNVAGGMSQWEGPKISGPLGTP